MPRKASNDINTVPCKTCGKVIRYKADVPRHNRLHDTNKAAMMYTCPFERCSYENLQKSNVTTHIRTHTGEKPKSCPECDYTTSDPGSLTRHRKRIHGYQPKRSGHTKAPTKQSRRYSPYTRESSTESSSVSSSPSPAHDETWDFGKFYETSIASPTESVSSQLPSCEAVDDNSHAPSNTLFSFAWEKDDLFCWDVEPSCSSYESLDPVLLEQMPPQLFPAVGAGRALEYDKTNVDGHSTESLFEDLSSFPFNLLFWQNVENIEPTNICPTATYVDPSPFTYSPHEATFAEKSNHELLLSYLFGVDQQPSQPDVALEAPSQNVSFDCSNFGNFAFIDSPTTPSSSPESVFLPFSCPSSPVVPYHDYPFFSPES